MSDQNDWRVAAGIPRRICVDKMTEAELAIRAAMEAVERAGGHIALTDAINLLHLAKNRVADFVDGVEPACLACARGELWARATPQTMETGVYTIHVLPCGHTKMERDK